jgi:hypothetical protein
VHALPSSQVAVANAWTQPIPDWQLSVVHGFWSSQLSVMPTHAPLLHLSPIVHALLSLQPCALFACVHPLPDWHASLVHALPSLQSAMVPTQPPS